MTLNVAFCRTLKPGMHGRDVVAHKRAVSRAMPQAYKWLGEDFTDFFGPAYQKAVKAYQHAHGIPQTGVIGKTTHTSLEKAHRHGSNTENAFDAYAAKLADDFCKEFSKTPEQRIREAGVAYALWAYAHRMATHYSQARPMILMKSGLPVRADCSGFATECYFAAGALDPNRRGYDGQGYTGTLIGHGKQVPSVWELKPLDLIFYGYTTRASGAFPVGSPTHVAVYVGEIAGKPSVVSDGHFPMGLYPHNYRTVNRYCTYDVTP